MAYSGIYAHNKTFTKRNYSMASNPDTDEKSGSMWYWLCLLKVLPAVPVSDHPMSLI